MIMPRDPSKDGTSLNGQGTPTLHTETLAKLQDRSAWLRRTLFDMVMRSRKGHIPSSFSCAETLLTLFYGGVLRYAHGAPNHPHRDRLIVSKGHAAMALYPILADIGYVPEEELENFTRKESLLRMYADPGIPGIDSITGSLGHGLGVAAGYALASRQDGRDQRAFAVLGDSECYEGSVWESALFGAHHGLDNLVTIVDRNGLAIMGQTEELLALDSLEEKFRAFGWHALSVDGHSYTALQSAFGQLGNTDGKPLAIIAQTVKGKGISFMENRSEWHNRMPDDEQEARARQDLQTNCITN